MSDEEAAAAAAAEAEAADGADGEGLAPEGEAVEGAAAEGEAGEVAPAPDAEPAEPPPPPPPPKPIQRTLALLKPDVCGRPWLEQFVSKVPPAEGEEVPDGAEDKWAPNAEMRAPDAATAILERIRKAGFTIVKQKRVHLSKAEAEDFYGEHAGKPFFDKLTGFMSSGTTMALVLEKEDGIAAWRAMMGPTNSLRARDEAEAAHPLNEELWALRALFGTDGTRNATHGSDSVFSAAREIAFFFPEKEVRQTSLALAWPSVTASSGACDAIAAALEAADFFVLARRVVAVPQAVAEVLVAAEGLQSEEEASAAVALLTSGPCEAFVVERVGAVPRLQRLVGPPPAVARGSAPASLRARFASDAGAGADAQQALGDLRVSAAPSADALRDVIMPALFPAPLPMQRTLCVIKPGTAEAHYRSIVADVLAAGFTILAEARRTLALEEVEDFYGEHAGKPFFPGLCAYMSSGPVVALALAKPNAIRCWRQLMGPTNTAVAKREKPNSLRARYGIDGTRNATHGSDAPSSAARELRFYFGDLAEDREPGSEGSSSSSSSSSAGAGAGAAASGGGASASAYVKHTVVTHAYDTTRRAIVPRTVEHVVVDALSALARARPASSPAEAIRWLGQWMCDNNPRHGVVRAPSSAASGAGPRVEEPDDAEVVSASATAASLSSSSASAAASSSSSAAGAGGAAAASSPALRSYALAPQARTIVFVLGGPGSGKGTQCARIAREFGYTHLSSGDLLRAEVASGSEFGRALEATMRTGGLVDDATVLRLLSQAIEAGERAGASKFLIDGYPRSQRQAIEFERAVGAPALVLAFDAPEAVLEARLLERGRTSGRADDNVESIRQRFATFVSQSAPVIDFYAKLGLVRSVYADRPVDAVWGDVAPLFRPALTWMVGGPGSGRATQADMLAARKTGTVHLSVGALADAAVAAADAVAAGKAAAPPAGSAAATALAIGAELSANRSRGDRAVGASAAVALLRHAIDGRNAVGAYALSDAPKDAETAAALVAAFGKPAAIVQFVVPTEVRLARALHARGDPAPRRAAELRPLLRRAIAAYDEAMAPILARAGVTARLHVVDGNRSAAAVAADVAAALQPDLVFVLGGPGVGKGTQCARIAKEFGYTHLSAGDLLRAEVLRGSAHGALISSSIEAGKLVPENITLDLLRGAVAAAAPRCRRFLIDGFPRDVGQAKAVEASIGAPAQVLFFDAPEDVMVARLLERGRTSGRADDNADAIRKRLHTFSEASLPVVRWYGERGAVRTISSVPPPDAVFASVRPFFEPHVVLVAGRPGAGATTQCARLAADFGFVHISAGDLVRAEIAERAAAAGGAGTIDADTEALAAALKAGAAPPDDLVLALVRDAVAAAAPRRRFLVDGFPASPAQADALPGIFGGQPSAVLLLDAPAAVCKARLQRRGKATAAAVAAIAKATAAKLAAVGGAGGAAAAAKSPVHAAAAAAAARLRSSTPDAPLGARDDDSDAAIDARLAAWEDPAAGAGAALARFREARIVKSFPVAGSGSVDLVTASLRPLFQPQLVVLAGGAGTGRRELAVRAGLELGYATLRVPALLREEAGAGSALSAVITEAMEAKRTVPTEAVVALLRRAVLRSGASRFIVDGFPRVVSAGFPSVHDQVFALEAALGPIKGCVGLVASESVRATRLGASTPGELAAVRAKVTSFAREKMPVLSFFTAVGKAATIDTSAVAPEDVYEAARPFLE